MAILLVLTSTCICFASDTIVSPYIEKNVNKQGNTIYSGTRTVGGNITWSFDDSTKTLTFSGQGAINDYPSSPMTDWYPLCSEIENLVIGEGIVYIGRENFANLENLKTVSLPKSLVNISMYAFMGCKKLEDIILPEGLVCIGTHAFYCCESIKTLNIPSTLVEIGDYALYGLNSIESFNVHENNKYFSSDGSGILFSKDKTILIKYPVSSKAESYTVPSSVKKIKEIAFLGANNLKTVTFERGSSLYEIEKSAFSNCNGIKKIVLPDALHIIGEDAFFACENLSEIVLSKNLQSIPARAFYLSTISQIEIPSSVKSIGDEAFCMCKKLKNVSIPEGTEVLGNNVFMYCQNLESVEIPSTVKQITNTHIGTFAEANSLKKITVSPDNQYFTSDSDGVLYNKEKTSLIHFPKKANITEYTVPEGVTELCHGTFKGATHLKKVTLPEGIVSIPHGAFMRCENLESVNIPQSVEYIGNNAFDFCHNLSYSFPENSNLKSIGSSAFSYNRVTTKVDLPKTLTSIGGQAFSFNIALESVNVPEQSALESFGLNIFTGCDRMTLYAPKGSFTEAHAKSVGIPLEIFVLIDGNEVIFDRMPVISSDRTMVPVRAVFEAIGGAVDYNAITKTVTAKIGEDNIVMVIGEETFKFNDRDIPLDAPAIILADRTLVPVRAIFEELGYSVDWNDTDRVVLITKN